ERSGVGQRVDTTLVQAFAAHDTWNAMIHHIARQYPEAFTQAGLADEGASVPNNPLFFRLLAALSADGRSLQSSQTTPRLLRAVVTVDDTALGAVRQPGPLVHLAVTPGEISRSAPELDEHGHELRATAAATAAAADTASTGSTATSGAGTAPPLAGVTIIEMG